MKGYFGAFFLLIVIGNSAIAGEASPAVSQLLGSVDQVLTRLRAPLELRPDELAMLGEQAQELTDPRTSKPYETVGKHVLPYYTLDSDVPASAEQSKTVLFIGGIHADEIAPMASAWHMLVELLAKRESLAPGVRVIYAPLTNPDGLISSTRMYGVPTRDNIHGVDLNRNFAHGNPETETRFLIDLIARFHPDTIVSLHGPYDWLDYDGPAKIKGADPAVVESVQGWLGAIQSAALVHIPINANFEIYQGSLGQYAGFKLKIHVLTFEYPTKDGSQGENDWKSFGPSLLRSLDPPR